MNTNHFNDNKLSKLFEIKLGRNIYLIRLSDIKEIKLIERNIYDNPETKEIKKKNFIFTIIGNNPMYFDENKNNVIYEKLLEVSFEENEYSIAYDLYKNLKIKWEEFLN
jgi:hypothetical protein